MMVQFQEDIDSNYLTNIGGHWTLRHIETIKIPDAVTQPVHNRSI